MEMPAAAKGADNSCTLAPDLSVVRKRSTLAKANSKRVGHTWLVGMGINLEDIPSLCGNLNWFPVTLALFQWSMPLSRGKRVTAPSFQLSSIFLGDGLKVPKNVVLCKQA